MAVVYIARDSRPVVEGIDVVDFPLRPVKVMGDWIQVVEFLGDDRPVGSP